MWLLRERLSYFRVKHLTSNWQPYMYTQKIANIFDHIQDHSRSGLENKFLENKSRWIFLRSTGLLYKFLPTNLRVFKPTFYNFYTPHLRWNSTIHHTELGQNAVFHNFSRQIALSQYSGRTKPFKNFRKFPKSPIRPAGSRFYSASCQCGRVFEWTLTELRFNVISNLLLFVLLFNGFSYNDV